VRIAWILSPGIVLFFLSPVIGELLSGSAPPAEFFNPLGFIMLAVLYGGGALLVRELTHRWGKGWGTLLVLGAAYGIAEEALMCKSFFDAGWIDLGPLASYGRWLGVNWVWAFELTAYHAVVSIAIPIALVNLLFPAQRGRSWVSRRKLAVLFALWVANAVAIFFFISPYRPPVAHYLTALAVTAALCVLAWRLPKGAPVVRRGSGKAAHPFWFLLIGFAGTFGWFFLVWVVPQTRVPAAATLGLMVLLVVVITGAVLRLSGGGRLPDQHRLALVSGALGFFILLAPLQELDKKRTDNTTGMALVGLAMLVLLLWIHRRIRRGEANPQFTVPS
jgi:hypothetical protein